MPWKTNGHNITALMGNYTSIRGRHIKKENITKVDPGNAPNPDPKEPEDIVVTTPALQPRSEFCPFLNVAFGDLFNILESNIPHL